MRFLIATHNKKKQAEMQRILGPLGIDVLTADMAGVTLTDVEETGETFRENAFLKAHSGCLESGLPCIADDSGLCVDVLDGEPGVLSARYAGGHGDDEANNDLLLRRMEGKQDRRAHFVCALALKFPGKEPYVVEGKCPGTILYKRQGTGGFGYDPLFLYEPMGKTYAEMNQEEKNQVSHRFRAAEKMREIMETIQG